MSDLDPRWEWTEMRRMGSAEPTYRKGRCRHLEVEPVESGGETVAHLCLTCDQQLPAEWVDRYREVRERINRMFEQSLRMDEAMTTMYQRRQEEVQ